MARGWIRQSRKCRTKIIHDHMVVNCGSMSSAHCAIRRRIMTDRSLAEGVPRSSPLARTGQCACGAGFQMDPGLVAAGIVESGDFWWMRRGWVDAAAAEGSFSSHSSQRNKRRLAWVPDLIVAMEADNHSDISSRRADGSSATGCFIALSMENGSLNAATNRRACSRREEQRPR